MYIIDSEKSFQSFVDDIKAHEDKLVVVCFCAAWCRTCAKYEEDFSALSQEFKDVIFAWIDIEVFGDEILGDEEIENFPTILLQHQGKNAFFGTMLPMISQLSRLIQSTTLPVTHPKEGPADLVKLLQS
ncbi:thioredoxin family protein [Basilea psittacipulmonis]|uniref:thioredoxin family protein n=1 Tax=Basilea psittacipulmonis TaxID=1472345 RepID=UPI000985909D|nr:thioredoxin family protein [Basilea psittacipulmonis]